jgi:hypothetical protein
MILAMASPTCTHLDQIKVTALRDAIVGCCDSSSNRRAPRHAQSERHPIAGSAEPGEEWSWRYVDEVALVIGE